jgi:hypothetical protein
MNDWKDELCIKVRELEALDRINSHGIIRSVIENEILRLIRANIDEIRFRNKKEEEERPTSHVVLTVDGFRIKLADTIEEIHERLNRLECKENIDEEEKGTEFDEVPEPIKIEVGEFYRSRDGGYIVFINEVGECKAHGIVIYKNNVSHLSMFNGSWQLDGHYFENKQIRGEDLVEQLDPSEVGGYIEKLWRSGNDEY